MIKQIQISTILGGWSPAEYFAQKGQFRSSLAIDPDMPKDEVTKRASGLLRPTSLAKFSGSNVSDVPYWFETTPKDTKIYAYMKDGKVATYTSALSSETLATTITSSSGNGCAYYDNKILFAKNTDIAAITDLSGANTVVQGYWVSTLGKTALTNNAYPTIKGVPIPNHHIHRHTDNKAYICDVSAANVGQLHYIKTTKTTVEGDTDNGSTYSALVLPWKGIWPVVTESYGTDLAIACIEGVDTSVSQRPAALVFWDTTSATAQKLIQVEFPDPLITALKNINGILYVFSGNAQGGVRVSRFIGGYTREELAYFEEGVPPLQGAIDHIFTRLAWGGFCTEPATAAAVFSLGSKNKQLMMGIQSILKATSAGANGIVTALKYVLHSSNNLRVPIVGWHDDSGNGIDKVSTTYGTAVFRSEMFRVGSKFEMLAMDIPLSQTLAANMTIVPTIYNDDGTVLKTCNTINATNFANKNLCHFNLDQAPGKGSFFLELAWSGSVLCTVSLPITLTINTLDNTND